MNNPMLADVIALKQQGADPDTAIQKLAEKYPAFRQFVPQQNLTPQGMMMMAQTAAQRMGIDPRILAQQAQGYMK